MIARTVTIWGAGSDRCKMVSGPLRAHKRLGSPCVGGGGGVGGGASLTAAGFGCRKLSQGKVLQTLCPVLCLLYDLVAPARVHSLIEVGAIYQAWGREMAVFRLSAGSLSRCSPLQGVIHRGIRGSQNVPLVHPQTPFTRPGHEADQQCGWDLQA